MSGLRIGWLDMSIICAYFAMVVLLGLWFARRRRNTGEDFFLAGRSASWPVIGASLFSANISSQQFVGQAGLAYTIGLAAGAFQLVGAMCFAFLAVLFLDVYRGLRLSTSPEFFERRYNLASRLFVSGINLIMIIAATITAALYAGATVLTDLLGWGGANAGTSFALAVGIIACATALYSVLGGLRSVLLVDYAQTFILIGGGVVVFVTALVAAGGPGEVASLTNSTGQSMWSVFLPADHKSGFGWLPLFAGGFILGIHAHCTDQDYVQRALSAKNLFHARMGALLAAFLKCVALFIIAAPGVLAARVFPGLASPDSAFPRMVIEHVPGGLQGLVLAGLLAAILSTVAAGLTASASLITYDFVLRARPTLSERSRVRLGRWLMVGILAACAVLAPMIRHFQGLYVYLVNVWALIAPPVFICAVIGLLWRRAEGRAAVSTLLVGSILGVGTFVVLRQPAWKATLPTLLQNPLMMGVVIAVVCAVMLVVMSMLARARRRTALGTAGLATAMVVPVVVWRPALSALLAPLEGDAVLLIVGAALGALSLAGVLCLSGPAIRGGGREAVARFDALRQHAEDAAMTPRQRRIYTAVLVAFVVTWAALLIVFSPLGIGAAAATAAAP
jgi:SSS family solute:Na+ symporter